MATTTLFPVCTQETCKYIDTENCDKISRRHSRGPHQRGCSTERDSYLSPFTFVGMHSKQLERCQVIYLQEILLTLNSVTILAA